MKKIVAVSGGVDSMVMLDQLVREEERRDDLVVAHFNHGTRPSAELDQKFVRRATEAYGVAFVTERVDLGAGVSEERARKARYEFLGRVAQNYGGEIYTAHHLGDLVESVAINLLRGTGWRGLVPLDATGVVRPLLLTPKREILRYAAEHEVVFRQDPTNVEEGYLRNRVRISLRGSEVEGAAAELYQRQRRIKAEVEELVEQVLADWSSEAYVREDFRRLAEYDQSVALEILRAVLLRSGITVTRPQLKDFLQAILTYAPEKTFNLPGGRLVKLHKTYFSL